MQEGAIPPAELAAQLRAGDANEMEEQRKREGPGDSARRQVPGKTLRFRLKHAGKACYTSRGGATHVLSE